MVAIEVWLSLGAFYDLRRREVPNWLTLPVLAVAFIWRLFHPNATALGVFVLTLVFWLSGLIAGGDTKGLMVLGLLNPTLYAWAWIGAGGMWGLWRIIKRERNYPGYLGILLGVSTYHILCCVFFKG